MADPKPLASQLVALQQTPSGSIYSMSSSQPSAHRLQPQDSKPTGSLTLTTLYSIFGTTILAIFHRQPQALIPLSSPSTPRAWRWIVFCYL